jgi:hypothetical protein
MSISNLMDYVFTAKYANYIPEKKRREVWAESTGRVKEMMLEKYKDIPEVHEDIEWAYKLVADKRVLGSQRAMQFGGPSVLKKHARIYNCISSYCDRLDFFKECYWLLLCGCGTGFSVQKHHVKKLPQLSENINFDKNMIIRIDDSIEGWADSLDMLLKSYMKDYSTGEYITFDYSLIRPKGAPLSHGMGKAPGPEILKSAHESIRKVLEKCISEGMTQLRPIDAYDIIMHCADSVVAGGHRRSATIALFSFDDDEMMNAKTGDWYYSNPQRGRSNNSIMLKRDETTLEQFQAIIKRTKEFGEPGFIFVDDLDQLTNPCQAPWAKVLTPDGIREFKDIDTGSLIWSKEGWTTVVKKWSTGINKVYKYTTTAGVFYGTEDHQLVSNGLKIKAKDCEDIDIFKGPEITDVTLNLQDIIDGIVIGDGSVHKASNDLVHLYIGDDDQDYFTSEIKDFITKHRPGINEKAYEVNTTITADELPLIINRNIPSRYFDKNKICGFLRGLYSANGSVCGNRITLKSCNFKLIEDVQLMLNSIGIRSYFTTNKPKKVKFENGEYLCKESYDLNISVDRDIFMRNIGFIQQYKNDKVKSIPVRKTKETYDIVSIEFVSEEETFDITVSNDSHTYWTQGCNVSNCAEIGFYCYDENGNSGWQACNLSEINIGKVKTQEDFYEACRAASIIGTLQAGFTDFPYLGEVSEGIIRKEALLGVSMTGIMENPEISLSADIQRKGAEIIKQTNKEIAQKIGINQASRTTCVKPSGTAAATLGVSSGIHPHHYKRYIRRVQANKQEEVLKYFKSINPIAVEDSVWSENKTDSVISFCCECKSMSKTKNDISALEFLQIVRDTQINWVMAGKNKDLCVRPFLEHNVSNTCVIRNDKEWDDVTEFIYNNRKYFTGISLLSMSGDKDYQQAPFTAVYLPSQIATEYGEGSILASGLIERALKAFNENLWIACDAALGIGYNYDEQLKSINEYKSQIKIHEDSQISEKHDMANMEAQLYFIDSIKKFANRYMSGDIKKTTYLLKDVYNWKHWSDLQREYKNVDYINMTEEDDNSNFMQESACSNGSCAII